MARRRRQIRPFGGGMCAMVRDDARRVKRLSCRGARWFAMIHCMRTLQGAYRRKLRLKARRANGSRWCVMVRHDAQVTDERPHTKEFAEPRRKVLGGAIVRAREGAGHPYRPSFAEVAGPPLGVRTLLKLEAGHPVSAPVYEAAGRTLGRYYEDWSTDTPLEILNGAEPPRGILRSSARRDLKPAPGAVSSSDAVESSSREESTTSGDQRSPRPEHYSDMEEFFRAVIDYQIKQGVPPDAIARAVDEIVSRYAQNAAEGDSPDTSGKASGSNG